MSTTYLRRPAGDDRPPSTFAFISRSFFSGRRRRAAAAAAVLFVSGGALLILDASPHESYKLSSSSSSYRAWWMDSGKFGGEGRDSAPAALAASTDGNSHLRAAAAAADDNDSDNEVFSRIAMAVEEGKDHGRLEGHRRRISVALPGGGCMVTTASVPHPPVTPVYAASYPGSGARMTWNLIEALTGLLTGDEYNYSRSGSNVVSIKTHYPHAEGIPLQDGIALTGRPIDRGFILLRNPRYAIPSLHSYVYEVRNDLPAHSTRAPIEEWRKWRDGNASHEVREWARSVEYWMDRLSPENRIIITYESLVNDNAGPATAKRLASFLARDPNVNPIDDSSVECVWRSVVKYHDSPSYVGPSTSGVFPGVAAEEGEKQNAQRRALVGSTAKSPSSIRPSPDLDRGTVGPKNERFHTRNFAIHAAVSQRRLEEEAPRAVRTESHEQGEREGKVEWQIQQKRNRKLYTLDGPTAKQAIEYALRDQNRAREAALFAQKNKQGKVSAATKVEDKSNWTGAQPLHPLSYRSGPSAKPYTKEQLKLMVETMKKLQAKYKGEDQLVNVLDGYIRDVQSLPGE